MVSLWPEPPTVKMTCSYGSVSYNAESFLLFNTLCSHVKYRTCERPQRSGSVLEKAQDSNELCNLRAMHNSVKVHVQNQRQIFVTGSCSGLKNLAFLRVSSCNWSLSLWIFCTAAQKFSAKVPTLKIHTKPVFFQSAISRLAETKWLHKYCRWNSPHNKMVSSCTERCVECPEASGGVLTQYFLGNVCLYSLAAGMTEIIIISKTSDTK